MTGSIPKNAHTMIIGAMKCGTSSLFAYLKGHPQICPARVKEPEFFSEYQGHGARVADYSELFHFDGSVHRYTLEASTGYTKYPAEPNVPKRIRDYGLQPKFIYIIRNPFDRIESHFSYMTQRDRSWMLDVDSAHLIDTSNYFLQLEQYRSYFPLEDILILDFDDLRRDPAALLRNVYAFLDLPDTHFPSDYKVVSATRNPAVSRVMKGLRDPRIEPILDWTPKPLKNFGKRVLRQIMPPTKRTLTADERDYIRARLEPDTRELRNIYGFDVGRWGF
jgi:hypothetical protein